MNSLNVVTLKFEKANAIKRFNRLRTITTLFRLIEILFLLIVISRFSVQIPVKISLFGEYLRRAYSAVFSHSFVFIVGNAIVVTLFFKSGRVSNSSKGLDQDPNHHSADFCKEYVEKKTSQVQLPTSTRCATVEASKDNLNFKADTRVKHENEKKVMGRSKSGELSSTKVPRKQLRRSETEVGKAEEMSGDEFRRRVEDFIARQQRSLREDEFSALVTY